MLWYLKEALTLQSEHNMKDKLNAMINEIENLTHLNADALMELDLGAIANRC